MKNKVKVIGWIQNRIAGGRYVHYVPKRNEMIVTDRHPVDLWRQDHNRYDFPSEIEQLREHLIELAWFPRPGYRVVFFREDYWFEHYSAEDVQSLSFETFEEAIQAVWEGCVNGAPISA
jgi:hypothetical protein